MTKPFTLVLFGTNMTYKEPGAPSTKSEYGETYTTVINLMELGRETQGEAAEVHKENEPLCTDTIHVIKGPDQLGFEVGDRIARGTLAILHAFTRGQSNISIVAYSRGAVEALLVAHEIDRIKNNVDDVLFWTKLTESPDQNRKCTHHAMNDDFASGMKNRFSDFIGKISSSFIMQNQFKTTLKNARLALFNHDPVPGGNWYGLRFRWKDTRFYYVPNVVKEYIQLVAQHELSRCFKPIIPKANQDVTEYKVLPIPGNHVTGIGNLCDQEKKEKNNPAFSAGQTADVQLLVMIKLINFLKKYGQKFKDIQTQQWLHSNIKRELSCGDLSELALYDRIFKNRASYSLLLNYTYSTGREESWMPQTKQDRQVHLYAHANVSLNTVFPQITTHVNEEHKELDLKIKYRQAITAQNIDEIRQYLRDQLEVFIRDGSEFHFPSEDDQGIFDSIQRHYQMIYADLMDCDFENIPIFLQNHMEKLHRGCSSIRETSASIFIPEIQRMLQVFSESIVIYKNTLSIQDVPGLISGIQGSRSLADPAHKPRDVRLEIVDDNRIGRENTTAVVASSPTLTLMHKDENTIALPLVDIEPLQSIHQVDHTDEVIYENLVAQLTSLTANYLKHLHTKTHQKNIDAKNDCVTHLLALLLDSSKTYKARSEEFYRYLGANDQITDHRDPVWKRYLLNTVKLLCIILTGILPGLAVWAIYSASTESSSPWFWQSHGLRFFNAAKTIEATTHKILVQPHEWNSPVLQEINERLSNSRLNHIPA